MYVLSIAHFTPTYTYLTRGRDTQVDSLRVLFIIIWSKKVRFAFPNNLWLRISVNYNRRLKPQCYLFFYFFLSDLFLILTRHIINCFLHTFLIITWFFSKLPTLFKSHTAKNIICLCTYIGRRVGFIETPIYNVYIYIYMPFDVRITIH